MRGRTGWLLAGLAVLFVVGCGKDGGSQSTSSKALVEFNAQFNGGRTTRWPNLPIRVFLGGVATPGEIEAWTAATGGAVRFSFVAGAGGADVVFRFRSGADVCGITFVEYTSDGLITSAEVYVSQSIYRTNVCVRTATHEAAHAIGFLSHTSDGGLMDEDGGDGTITPAVAGMLRELYLLAPGTVVTSERARLAERRGGRRQVMTFVSPVRR